MAKHFSETVQVVDKEGEPNDATHPLYTSTILDASVVLGADWGPTDFAIGVGGQRKDSATASVIVTGKYGSFSFDGYDCAWVNFTRAGVRAPGTIAAGGTAQNVFSATPTNGWEIINTHQTETLFVRENGTAAGTYNSEDIPIPPGGSYATPTGYKPTGDVSAKAVTTGHAFIARRW